MHNGPGFKTHTNDNQKVNVNGHSFIYIIHHSYSHINFFINFKCQALIL